MSASFEMSIIYNGHLAGERVAVVSSDSRCVGTKRIWPVGIRMRGVKFIWPLMDAEFHGVSSQIGRTSTAGNAVSLLSEEASA